ncbi:hypothetical protein AK812_SmicGene19485 [Symbiodinium microadriaticum]|uniref:Uncharacterized protein n=1 Tax=Symbiodinium microadriaticum TaxID=2951 RepID=A0A1Q9DSE9_SYMMI|nr:hypothetical protein AK812_SmicGene19485 [Symbiodinium microadriaticum]
MRLPLPPGVVGDICLQDARLVDAMSANASAAPTVALQSSQPNPQASVSPPNASQDVCPVPHKLTYDDFLVQYRRYVEGTISAAYVLEMWGEPTLDLMQAQQIVEDMDRDMATRCGTRAPRVREIRRKRLSLKGTASWAKKRKAYAAG